MLQVNWPFITCNNVDSIQTITKKCCSWPKVTNRARYDIDRTFTQLHSHWIKAWEFFHAVWIALSTSLWLCHTPKRPHASFTSIKYLYHVQLSSCTNFCIRRCVGCFIYTYELKYKVLKYYVVLKLSHQKIPTNRVSVALWCSLNWLLFQYETFPRSIQWN